MPLRAGTQRTRRRHVSNESIVATASEHVYSEEGTGGRGEFMYGNGRGAVVSVFVRLVVESRRWSLFLREAIGNQRVLSLLSNTYLFFGSEPTVNCKPHLPVRESTSTHVTNICTEVQTNFMYESMGL